MHYYIRLTADARLDLRQWLDFLPQCSGKSLILNSQAQQCTYSQMPEVVTDGVLTDLPISLDTYPAKHGYYTERTICHCDCCSYLGTLLATAKTKQKDFHCDNQAVVDIWKKGSTRAPQTMALVRLLYFCAAYHNLNVCIVHIPGICNDIADSLSHFQMDRFRKLAPQANTTPDNIPTWPVQSFMHTSCNATIMV